MMLWFALRVHGVPGYYKGLAPNLLRVVPATALTFVVYENVSQFLFGLRNDDKSSQQEQKEGASDEEQSS